MDGPLAGLPGASTDAGAGRVVDPLLEGLLIAPATAAARREQARAWYAHLLGPWLVPAPAVPVLLAELTPGDVAVRVALAAEPAPVDPAGVLGLRDARNRLLDDDRLELTAVHVPLPAGGDPESALRALLADLDFTVPAWVEIPPVPGWERAVETLVADGAERLALRLPAPGEDAAAAAAVLRLAVDRDLSLRAIGAGPASAVGALVALCAVRAALNGAEAPELAAVLAEQTPTPLAAALRRMSEADAAVARVFLDGVVVESVQPVVDALAGWGLTGPQEP
jgi:hypothetical protein